MIMQNSAQKTTSYQMGLLAEQAVASYLRCRGFTIMAQRYRTDAGEIDLIAHKGRVIHFIEVKKRGALEKARQCISLHQRQRVARAAEIFLAQHAVSPEWDNQFDAVFVVGKALYWLPDAWRVDDVYNDSLSNERDDHF